MTLALILFVVVTLVLLAGYIERNSAVPVEFSGSTHIVAKSAGSTTDLAAMGVSNPDKLNLPEGVGRYDLVTFDIPTIQEQLKVGKEFPVRIRGKEYFATITNVRERKDGIIEYGGKLPGEKDHNLGITVGPDVILGYVQLNREYFWIGRAEKNARPEYNSSPIHYIYSMNDVGPFNSWLPAEIRYPLNSFYRIMPFWHEGGLCGGNFEVYLYNTTNSTPLTESDFSAFPELDAVIRGGKNTKATCGDYSGDYSNCVGGGHFKCHEGSIVYQYGSTPLEYDNNVYILKVTTIS
jgi:hypothetical protein